jgi:anhydro-N-acetylmuramic acid kinase
MRIIGLMSGTSLDGIDAALVRFEGGPDQLHWTVEAFISIPLSDAQREQVHSAIVNGNAASICRVNADLGEWLAEAALRVLHIADVDPNEIDAIGSHGQTIWHEPPGPERRGATLQLGCAATIAERTGISVVSDFRTRDVAAGGQGAPLVPWVDRLLFALPDRRRVLLNIGGMANLTWLPPRGSDQPLLAFDTGPGNALINAAVEVYTDGRETFDRDGLHAAAGTVDDVLLNELLSDPYYNIDPPKSTGREVYGKPFVQALIDRHDRLQGDANRTIATLTELTARSIAQSIRRWALPRGVDEVVVTGGGVRNPEIMRRLREQLAPLPVLSGEVLGLNPDAKEAVAFAALAWAYLNGLTGNEPTATGALGPRVLGSYTPGVRRRQS